MYSSSTGRNGPITYSVVNTDYTATEKATIAPSTGVLTTLLQGQIKVGMTYAGAPWIWYRTVRIAIFYGCRDYLEISSASDPLYSQMNCLGYALNTTANLTGWYVINEQEYLLNPDENIVFDAILPFFEMWLDDNIGPGNWECVTHLGGINATLLENQWLIAMRVGFHPGFEDSLDCHFWYRTSTGEWANKHGFDSYS